MNVEFVQMGKKFFHQPGLKRSHETVQVIQDLFFCGFEVMVNDLLLIHFIIFGTVDGLPGKQIFQETPCAFAIDV